MPKTTPGAIVRDARERAGISRSVLAGQVGVSVNTLVRLENHDMLPNSRSLILIARQLEIDLNRVAETANV